MRDPELKLDEIAQMQDEVATLLAFGGPAADAAKAVGVTLTVDGVVPASDAAEPTESTPEAETAEPDAAEPENTEAATAEIEVEITTTESSHEPSSI